MCPGMVRTGITGLLPLPARIVMDLVMLLRGRTAEEGARLVIHAIAVTGPETHGQFLLDKDVQPQVIFHSLRISIFD